MLYFHSTATWSAKCGAFWEESPHSDYCYQFNSRLLSVCLCVSVCVLCSCYVHVMLYFHSTATWSAKCGAFWEESPHSDYCYQFNSRLLSVCLSVCLCVCVCVMFMICLCYVIFSFYSYVECQMWCILGGEPPL